MIEKRGRALTPGERFKVWVDNILKLWPIIVPLLGLSVYGNSETVRDMVNGAEPPPTIEDVTPPTQPEYYRQSIEDIITKIKKLEAQGEQVRNTLQSNINAVEVKDEHDHEAINKRIMKLEEWH